MYKQLISLLLSPALVLSLFATTFGASTQEEKAAKETAAVKARVEKIAIRTTVVKITLRNSTKLKGYLQEIADDYCVISDTRTSAVTKVAYAQILNLKEVKEHHLSQNKKIAIALGVFTVLYTWASMTDQP